MDSPLPRHLFSRALRASLASLLVLAGCGPELKSYSAPICMDRAFAVSDLSPAVPVDFAQLRLFFTSSGGDSPSEVVLGSWGTACATASDKAACESALSHLSPRSGFRGSYLATTRGDEVSAHTSLEALKGFLGPIDTAHEAALVAYASHDDLSCGEVSHGAVRENEGGGFSIIASRAEGCDVIQFILDVSVSGEVKEVRRYVLHPGPPNCQT